MAASFSVDGDDRLEVAERAPQDGDEVALVAPRLLEVAPHAARRLFALPT